MDLLRAGFLGFDLPVVGKTAKKSVCSTQNKSSSKKNNLIILVAFAGFVGESQGRKRILLRYFLAVMSALHN